MVASASIADKVRVLSLKARLLTLDHLDKRSVAYRRVNETISALTSDIGDDPSEGQRQLIERAAVTAAIIADVESKWLSGAAPVDPVTYTTLTNGLRRLLETIGLERRARDVTPSIGQFLADLEARKSAEPAADSAGAPVAPQHRADGQPTHQRPSNSVPSTNGGDNG